ncbi:UPF0158 family protein [Elusimicrobiota bacterium]
MTTSTIKFADVLEAYEFASFGDLIEHEAFICLRTGKIFLHSEDGDEDEPLPDDIDEPGRYVALPHKNDLDLGRDLVDDFVSEALPDAMGKVRQIFSGPGAYARYKDLLENRGMLDRWYKYENEAQERALREWCKENGINTDG